MTPDSFYHKLLIFIKGKPEKVFQKNIYMSRDAQQISGYDIHQNTEPFCLRNEQEFKNMPSENYNKVSLSHQFQNTLLFAFQSLSPTKKSSLSRSTQANTDRKPTTASRYSTGMSLKVAKWHSAGCDLFCWFLICVGCVLHLFYNIMVRNMYFLEHWEKLLSFGNSD